MTTRQAVKIPLRPALCFCAGHLLAAVLAAQCNSVSQVPNGSITSGTACYSSSTTLTAGSVTIGGSASVTFIAGGSIQLLPGFQAIAGTAGTTFQAYVETAPSAVSASPASGTGLSQAFTWTVASPSGHSNLSDVFALFNTSVLGANACYIHYNVTSKRAVPGRQHRGRLAAGRHGPREFQQREQLAAASPASGRRSAPPGRSSR